MWFVLPGCLLMIYIEDLIFSLLAPCFTLLQLLHYGSTRPFIGATTLYTYMNFQDCGLFYCMSRLFLRVSMFWIRSIYLRLSVIYNTCFLLHCVFSLHAWPIDMCQCVLGALCYLFNNATRDKRCWTLRTSQNNYNFFQYDIRMGTTLHILLDMYLKTHNCFDKDRRELLIQCFGKKLIQGIILLQILS